MYDYRVMRRVKAMAMDSPDTIRYAWTSSSDDEMISSASEVSLDDKEKSQMIQPYRYPILVYHR